MNNEDIKEPTSASKNGETLVDTSVESKAVEPNLQPINPPKTTELKPQELPHIGNEVDNEVKDVKDEVSEEDKKRKAWVEEQMRKGREAEEKQARTRLAEGITKNKRVDEWDESPDEWNEAEERVIRGLMKSTLSLPNNKSNDELKADIQGILDNPSNLIYPKTQLGKDLRDNYLNNVMNTSYKELGKVKDWMNDLSSLRQLYAIATTSENPNIRKEAIKRINKIEDNTNAFLENMDDQKKLELKNYMLLTEYAQAFEDLKYQRDEKDIWILARDGAPPIITEKPVKGAYKTTVGDFKGDIFRLLSNRSTGDVFLPSGLTKTRRKPNDTDLYAIDFDQFFNPYRYIRMDKEKQNQLAKDGLTRYFDMTQPDYTPITESMDRNTYMLIEAIKSNKELTEQQKQAEIEKIKREADERLRKEQNRRQKAEQDAQRAEKELQEEYEIQDTMRRNAADKAQDEAYRQAEKQQAKDATSMDPDVVKDIAKMDYNKELEGVKKNIRVAENALLVANNNVTEAGLRRLLSGLEKYAQNLELMRSVGGTGDPNIIADALRDLGGIIQKNPAVRTVLKAAEWAPYIGLVVSAYDVGKDFYDKWQDKENFYSDLHNRERFKTYFDKAFEAYPNAKKYYLENMDSPQDMKALWKLQLKDNVPKYQEQTQTSSYVYPNRENISSILSGMRKTDMNIIRRAAEGYGEKYTKESTRNQVNPYKSSKSDILDMLGLTNLKNVQDKEIQMLRKNPWMLPFMQSFHSTSSPEFRDEVYKRLLKQWKTAFRDFSE
jgi:hypothetical protein